MMTFPEMIRNVAVVGHLHHGKTALMDMLVFETHKLAWDADKPVCELASLSYHSLCFVHSRQGIQTPTSCRVSEKFLSSLHRCLSYYLRRVASHIWCTSLILRDTSISLTKWLLQCVLLMEYYWLWMSLKGSVDSSTHAVRSGELNYWDR